MYLIGFMFTGLLFFLLSFIVGMLANGMTPIRLYRSESSDYDITMQEQMMDVSTGLGLVGMVLFFLAVACM